MPVVGFEPAIPAFERANAVHALDRAGTVMGQITYIVIKYVGRKLGLIIIEEKTLR
jgi:hypothetical protein